MEKKQQKFITEVIKLSIDNIDDGGGPFAAIIVKHGEIISKGVNSVTTQNDPTAHAEINAIRKASKKFNSFKLTGCEIYCSCEPCPMCLSAIYWARIDKIFYANTKEDAKNIGFDDSFIYDELKLPALNRKIKCIHIHDNSALKAFSKWDKKKDKISY